MLSEQFECSANRIRANSLLTLSEKRFDHVNRFSRARSAYGRCDAASPQILNISTSSRVTDPCLHYVSAVASAREPRRQLGSCSRRSPTAPPERPCHGPGERIPLVGFRTLRHER